MGLFNWLNGLFMMEGPTNTGLSNDPADLFDSTSSGPSINPATGLPMVGGVDIEGNPYGVGSIDHDFMNDSFSTCGFDDGFCGSSFDDW